MSLLLRPYATQSGADFVALLGRPYAPFTVGVFAPDAVSAAVLGAGQQFKVFKTIVTTIFVDVVNMLVAGKQSLKETFHNPPMLKDIPTFGVRMRRHEISNVSIIIDIAPNFGSCQSRLAEYSLRFCGSDVNAFWHEGESQCQH